METDAQPARPLRSDRRPGLSTWLGLLVLGVALTSWKLLIAGDADLATHLRLGQDILEHGFPHSVPLLRGEGPAWDTAIVLSEWGFEVLLATCYGALGWSGPLLVCALLLCSPFWLAAVLLRGRDVGFWGVLVAVLCLLVLSAHHVAGRPHLVSWTLLLPWTATWRAWVRGERSDARTLAIVAPCMLLWANLHGGFLAGLAVAGIVVVAAGPARWPRGGLLLACCVAASCITPWGPALYPELLGFLADRWVIEHTEDFRPLSLSSALGLRTAVAVALAGLGLTLDRRRPTCDVLLWLACSLFAFGAVRNVPIAAMVLVVPIAESWARVIVRLAERGSRIARAMLESSARIPAGGARAGALWLPAGAVAGVALLAAAGVPGPTLPSDRAPSAAWERVEARPDETVFTDFMYGGFVAFWRGAPFVHPLNLSYPRSRLEEYARVNQAEPGWQEVLARHRIEWLLVRPDSAIARALESTPGCEISYRDRLAVVARCSREPAVDAASPARAGMATGSAGRPRSVRPRESGHERDHIRSAVTTSPPGRS